MLTNYQSEIPEYFQVGKDLETFSGEEELLDKIGYYLEHDKEREEIAQNGYRKAKEHYSLERRVRQLLEIALGTGKGTEAL